MGNQLSFTDEYSKNISTTANDSTTRVTTKSFQTYWENYRDFAKSGEEQSRLWNEKRRR